MKRQNDILRQPEMAYLLEVYNAETNKRIGHLVDVREESLLLESPDIMPLGRKMPLKVLVNQNAGWNEHIELRGIVTGVCDSLHRQNHRCYEVSYAMPANDVRPIITRIRHLAEAEEADHR